MMKRIIGRLDIKGPNLVKGIHLEGLRVLGDPQSYAQQYAKDGIDELLLQDVVASLYDRNSLHDIVKGIAQNIFVPITAGGGIRTISDIRELLKSGADKVSINSEAIKNPKFITKASNYFGSSTIVVAIEYIRHRDGSCYCYYDNGREPSGIEVMEWASRVQDLGAGEVILTSVDRDGTKSGMDLKLISEVSRNLEIPVIAHGGIGSIDHIEEALRLDEVSALAIASYLHYGNILKPNNDITNKNEGNFTYLQSTDFRIKGVNVSEIKRELINRNLEVRF